MFLLPRGIVNAYLSYRSGALVNSRHFPINRSCFWPQKEHTIPQIFDDQLNRECSIVWPVLRTVEVRYNAALCTQSCHYLDR